jgi:serine/threonine-protein kinase
VEIGTVLNEKYRLLALIGQGGMGTVWRAQHLGLDSPVALKLMTPEMAAHPEALARFTREAKAAASLRSPHVVQVLDYGVDGATNEPFIVMELLEGESLSARIRQRGGLSLGETSRIILQVARALTLAHAAKIVHRDLKPDNIFLVKNADDEIAKVLDFGIAKSSQLSGMQTLGMTATGSVLGTPYYMSPEQITNSKNVDHRSDLWSLTVITCECLTGQRPFQADTAMSLAVMICQGQGQKPSSLALVPEGFDEWFARGTAADRDQRFQSASELSESLQNLFELGTTSLAGGALASAAAAARPRAPLPSGVGILPSSDATAAPAAPFAELGSVGPLSRTASAVLPAASERPRRRANWLTPVIAVVAALVAGGGVWLLARASTETDFRSAPAAAPAAVDGRTARPATVDGTPAPLAPQVASPRVAPVVPAPPKSDDPAGVTAAPLPPAVLPPSKVDVVSVTSGAEPETELAEPAAVKPKAAPATASPARPVRRARAQPSTTAPKRKPAAAEPAPSQSFDPYGNL